MTTPVPSWQDIAYDPELDNCGRPDDGSPGCRNDDGRRVVFSYFGLMFACPACFENTFAGLPDPDQIIDIGAPVRSTA